MHGPLNKKIITYTGIPQKAVWQKMQKLNMDHQAVIGHMSNKKSTKNIFALYNEHIKLLNSLK